MIIDLPAQISEVKRELAMRKQVYRGLIARGKLDEREAAQRYIALEAVLKTLQQLQQSELI